MRDILNLFNTSLAEANLGASQIPAKKMSAVINPETNKPYSRHELFLQKVKTGSPFTKVDGSEVVIDRDDTKLVADWLATGPAGTITMRTTDGGTVKNTELQKTVEFGSKEAETLKIKGSDVFATQDQEVTDFGNNIEELLQAGGFPASEMYNMIAKSSTHSN